MLQKRCNDGNKNTKQYCPDKIRYMKPWDKKTYQKNNNTINNKGKKPKTKEIQRERYEKKQWFQQSI